MSRLPAEADYPIAAVSKLTGVSCHALRVWERRYGFPVPRRAPSGHRRYTHEQVLILRRLSELAGEGRSIGDLVADYQAGRLRIDLAVGTPGGTADDESATLVQILDLLQRGDISGAELSFEQARHRLGPVELIGRVVGPALTETGERWFRRRCSVYHERCISGFLRQKLADLACEARRRNTAPARTAVVGTVQGDRHEGGVLIVHALLEHAGWRVLNLGTDVPVSEYARALTDLRPDALALSFVLSRNINKRFQELGRLEGVPVFVGGRSILNYQNLARRHGLIPVAGPATAAVGQLLREFDDWSKRRRPPAKRPADTPYAP